MPRKIEKEDALGRALALFWEHGYRGTSMDMLTQRLGVEKPSIYATFGSKRDLYLASLARYREELLKTMRDLLEHAPTPHQGLRRAVKQMMAPGRPGGLSGCFAANAALELADHDPEVIAVVKNTFAAMEGLFRKAIERGQATEDIRSDRPAADLAKFLVSAISGARVMGKSRSSARSLDAVAQLTLGLLDP